MSLSTRQIASTAKTASKRGPILASIGQSAPAARMRTRSYSPRASSCRPTLNTRALAPLPRFASTLNEKPVATSPVPTISAENTYDVVIIGAGNAGLALAASLREDFSISKGCDSRLTLLSSALQCQRSTY
jgi:NADPH-dependent 2,4-dienoyl-CoA reductase/sulfur reductase-like enzyme